MRKDAWKHKEKGGKSTSFPVVYCCQKPEGGFPTMATIPQPVLFSWKEVACSPQIDILRMVLETLPDQELIHQLERERKERRDDFPLRALWNALIAKQVLGHESIASLVRELGRNAELREICGFDPLQTQMPKDYHFSRLEKKLSDHESLVDQIFSKLRQQLTQSLPDYGRETAIDGKAIATLGQNDPDANWGCKTKVIQGADGQIKEKQEWWYGYKAHLLVDAHYELPLAWDLTKASHSETTMLMPMIQRLEKEQPDLLARIQGLRADRGYDDGADKKALYDGYGIAPLIDTRDLHQGRMQPLAPQHHDTVYYSPTGRVCCKVDPMEGNPDKAYADMQFMGFEPDRQTLKFRCPAAAYGLECKNREACQCAPAVRDGEYGRVVRVNLDRDRRIFMPIHRHSQAFEREYAKRTSVERVNSRIDLVYGFEHHYLRGIKRMRLMVSLSMIVMSATALGCVKKGQQEKMRRLRTAV
jgi:hypothetical protein